MYPYCIGTGNQTNNTTGTHADYYAILDVAQQYASHGVQLQFDCSNYFLNEQEIEFNNYLNCILSLNDAGDSYIEISNHTLIEKFRENYNFNGFILGSNNCFSDSEADIQAMNEILLNPEFHKFCLNPQLNNNKEVLKQLKNRHKLVITVNPLCPLDCPNRFSCYHTESLHIKEFSSKSAFYLCDKRFNLNANPQMVPVTSLKAQYGSLGINSFTFDSFEPMASYNMQAVKSFYIRYFIKPEFYEMAENEI